MNELERIADHQREIERLAPLAINLDEVKKANEVTLGDMGIHNRAAFRAQFKRPPKQRRRRGIRR